MPTPPTGTVTFLFTDIQGSTRLWEQHADAMRPALARHDDLLHQAIAGNNGYVFKTVGDAFCAAFPTAPDALGAALSAQLAVAAEPWPLPTPLLVRMALHTGAAEERGGDYFGPPLNRVARLMAAGHGGQVLLSGAAQGLVQDALPGEAMLSDLGERRLKDLGRPERVFQLRHPSLPADFPPLRSLDNPDLPNNLPPQPTSFVGREKQVAEVKALLAKSRLVTLTGAGGAGKTRLSLQAAADLLDGEGDGVWLVELAALSDPALVPQAVASVLGVKEEPGRTLTQTLAEWLKPKRLLLVLDNCEHLVAACATLATDLLRSCPQVHFLASSREPLNVSGEQTYRVPSLSLPDPQKPQTVESLSEYEAVRLFLQRAQAVQPSFAVTNGNAPAVAQVCFHLDGIPLAIELAAARVRVLTVEQIMARLDDRFRLLTGGSRSTLPRQQTLRALIDWSYDLLTDQEKTLLARLSVFAGGWTLEAAESVVAGEGIEDWEVLDLLTGLVDKSLAVFEEETEGAAARYRLLETVRQYAHDRLAERGEAETVQDRAAAWFLALAQAAEAHMEKPEQAAWLSRLDADHDNLRAALAWEEQAPHPAAVRLASTLGHFWQVRGHLSEGRRWLGRALERTTDAADQDARRVRGKLLYEAGALAYSQGDYAAARAFFGESLTVKRALGDQKGAAQALQSLGTVAFNQADYAGARALLEESLAQARTLGDPRGMAYCLYNLGAVTYNQGDYAAAQDFFDESLTLRRQLGNARGIADCLVSLGSLASRQGDLATAQALQEEGLALARDLGDVGGIANSLVSLGATTASRGDLAAGRALIEESGTLYRQIGSQEGIAYSLECLAGLALKQGDWAGAAALNRESLAVYRPMGDREGIVGSLEGLAGAARGQDRPARAARLWGAAAALRQALGSLLSPADRETRDQGVAAVRASLGEEAFAAAWAEGQALDWDPAADYALGERE